MLYPLYSNRYSRLVTLSAKEDIRKFGNLSYKSTWEAAIAQAEATPPQMDKPAPKQPPMGERATLPQPKEVVSQEQSHNQCTMKKLSIGFDDTKQMDEPAPKQPPMGGRATLPQPKEVVSQEQSHNQCTMKKLSIGYDDTHNVVVVSGACDGIEETIAQVRTYEEAQQLADEVELKFGQQVIIRHWAGDETTLWRCYQDEVDPDTIPELKKTDPCFHPWTPWMKAGAKFTNPQGIRFTIIGFDCWGNCHARADNSERLSVFKLTKMAGCLPEADDFTRDQVLKKFQQAGASDTDIAEMKATPLSAIAASMVLGFLENFTGQTVVTGVVVSFLVSFFALG